MLRLLLIYLDVQTHHFFGQLVCSNFCCDVIFIFENALQIYVCSETPYCCFHTVKVNPPPSFAGNDIVIIFLGLEGDIHGAFLGPLSLDFTSAQDPVHITIISLWHELHDDM